MTGDEVLAQLHIAALVVTDALAGFDDWLAAGQRPTQYALDLVADGPVTSFLLDAGFGVLSEESGCTEVEREIVVVVDPVDGSTNASRRIPHYNTALCAVDRTGPLAAVVRNQATGECFEAVRGGGARLDGQPIRPTGATDLHGSIIAFNGLPSHHWGWDQYRAFGAGALDLCAVACGRVDGYVDATEGNHGPWDYLAGLLICAEAGAVVTDAQGCELVVLDHAARRTPIAAATPELHATLAELRTAQA